MIADQVIDKTTARQLHAEAVRTRALAAWIVMNDQPDYQGKFVARLVTAEATPYVLVADTLVQLRETLPRGLDYADRTPADPKGVVEIWFAPEGARS